MYKIFSHEFAMEMKKLCIGADVIIPNITEACFLSGVEYRKGPYSEEYINLLVEKLGDLKIKNLVLTGVTYDNDSLGALAVNYETDEKFYYKREVIKDYFHGTGDCFASAFVAALTNGKDLKEATKLAVDFTVNSILHTVKYSNIDKKYGVCFEEELPNFSQEFVK
jgi:pyridoxine kinase